MVLKFTKAHAIQLISKRFRGIPKSRRRIDSLPKFRIRQLARISARCAKRLQGQLRARRVGNGPRARLGRHFHDMVKRQNSSKKLKPQRRPLNPQQQQWQPPTSDDYSNQTASGFRHGFRPVSLPGHQNGGFRPQMGANRYPDQVRK